MALGMFLPKGPSGDAISDERGTPVTHSRPSLPGECEGPRMGARVEIEASLLDCKAKRDQDRLDSPRNDQRLVRNPDLTGLFISLS